MKRLLPALLLVIGIGVPSAGGIVCEFDASAVKTVLHINGLCDSYKLYATGPNDFSVVCPGTVPPANGVELRRYYDFKVYGS